MSAEGETLYSNLFLLTLKGRVSLFFIDGDILEGEVVAQDALNIFLLVDDEPFMIPRSQIRYVKGGYGQQIEKDTSLEFFMEAEPAAVPETKLPETVTETAIPEEIETGELEVELATWDGSDDGQTFVIAPEMEEFVSEVEETEVPAPVIEDLEDTGMTFVIEDAELSAELEEIAAAEADEDTLVLEEEEEVVAQLVCTAGPHAGELLNLSSGVITLGRAKDNDFSLSNDKEISRRHALIVPEEAGQFMIQDQNSLNGTFVNGELVEGSRYLEDGDVILIGVSELKYQEK